MGAKRDTEYLMALGNRIRSLRTSKNWSQYDLAETSDLERSQIARIELGKLNPKICSLKSIAEALDVSVSELLNF